MIVGGGSPKNFYLQAQPTLWEVYGIEKGGNDYFIEITTDQVVWGGLFGATPAEAVSWGKVIPACSRIRYGLLRLDHCLSVVLRICRGVSQWSPHAPGVVHRRDELLADLTLRAKQVEKEKSQKLEVRSQNIV